MRTRRGKEAPLEKLFPVWASWYNQLEVPETTRKGIPKGDPLPIGGAKFRAAAIMTLFPRGLHTTDEIGERIDRSGAVVRNWRGEKSFRTSVRKLESDFATFLLQNLVDKEFFLTVYEREPVVWSDRVLEIVSVNLGHRLKDRTFVSAGDYLVEAVYRKLGFPEDFDLYEALKIPRIEFDAPDDPQLEAMWKDFDWAISDAYFSLPMDKPGPKPKKPQPQRDTALLYRFSIMLQRTLQEIDHALSDGKPKEKVLRLIRQANAISFNLTERLKE